LHCEQKLFCAREKREVILELPNSVGISQICLTKVLYSPEVGYILVLIGYLDEMDFTTTFLNGT